MAKTITVEISKDGKASVDLAGFEGEGCEAVAKAFDELGKVETTEKKPEFYKGSGNKNTVCGGR
jgi:hypothetical protein